MNFARASALGLMLCALAGPAFAQTFGSPGTGPNGPYLRGEGGWSHMNDMTGHTTTGTIYTSKQDEGFAVGGAAGWKLDQLRLELGLDFSNSGIKEIDLNNVPSASASGSVKNTSGMVRALWDLRTGTPFVPYIGIGVGASHVTLDNARYNGTTLSNSSDTVFAYEPIVGVNYLILPNIALGLEYRYFATVDPSFSYAPGGRLGLKNESHNVLASLTWYFGVPEPTPAMQPGPTIYQPQPEAGPPAVPPPVPPPPPAPLVYIVFFNLNSAALTPEGHQVVAQAASAFQQNGKAEIKLTGYTDTAGSPRHNLALSRVRAVAVRDELVRLGVPASDIGIAWKGEADLRVPTANGVREPQNRRVEIVIP
ncbi:MAG: outer membrane beta-barrel protein [Alphaproteobacteria bacterium]|nr:outer membrane beta-barrel protein [Alphaproteobacteria bacterium]